MPNLRLYSCILGSGKYLSLINLYIQRKKRYPVQVREGDKGGGTDKVTCFQVDPRTS